MQQLFCQMVTPNSPGDMDQRCDHRVSHGFIVLVPEIEEDHMITTCQGGECVQGLLNILFQQRFPGGDDSLSSVLGRQAVSTEQKNGGKKQDNNAAQHDRTDIPEVEWKVGIDEGKHALLSHIGCRYQW
jgi:hypothetical protein